MSGATVSSFHNIPALDFTTGGWLVRLLDDSTIQFNGIRGANAVKMYASYYDHNDRHN